MSSEGKREDQQTYSEDGGEDIGLSVGVAVSAHAEVDLLRVGVTLERLGDTCTAINASVLRLVQEFAVKIEAGKSGGERNESSDMRPRLDSARPALQSRLEGLNSMTVRGMHVPRMGSGGPAGTLDQTLTPRTRAAVRLGRAEARKNAVRVADSIVKDIQIVDRSHVKRKGWR